MAGNSVEHAAEARAALHAIVSDPDHGVAALSDEKVLTSLLKDLLPDAPRETAILVAAAQNRVTVALRESVAQGLDAGTAIRLAAAAFARATLFMPEACDWAVSELALALGLSAAGDAGQPGTGAGAAVADAQAPVAQPPASSAYQAGGGQAPMDPSPAGLAGAPSEAAGQGFGQQPATVNPQGPRPAPGETATATPQGWPASPPGGSAPGKPRRTTAVLILAGAAVVIVAAAAFFLFGKSSPGPHALRYRDVRPDQQFRVHQPGLRAGRDGRVLRDWDHAGHWQRAGRVPGQVPRRDIRRQPSAEGRRKLNVHRPHHLRGEKHTDGHVHARQGHRDIHRDHRVGNL